MADRSLSVEIVAPAAPVWSGTAAFVTIPGAAGSIGIYPRHEPLLASLGEGEVRLQHDRDSDAWLRVHVRGGFVSVDSDVVTIVADEAAVAGG
jgi:F-type H+-transporting ATPase subunit epsilon